MKHKDINAYILAGGKSSRMHVDKAFLQIDGRFFIDIIIESLSLNFENLFIVGKDYSHPLVKEAIPDLVKGKGPIGGILTALSHSDREINFIIGLDYPLIDSRITDIILNISKEDNFLHLSYVPVLEDGIHPLFALYNKKLINRIIQCISKGSYQVRCIFDSSNTKFVNLIIKAAEYSDNMNEKEIKRCFYNINTPDDYKKLFEMLKK